MEDLTKKIKEEEMVELMDIAKVIANEISTKLVDFKNNDTDINFLLEVEKEKGKSYDDYWLSLNPALKPSGFITKVSIPLTASLSRALWLMNKDANFSESGIAYSLYTFLKNTSVTIDVLEILNFNSSLQLQLETKKVINLIPEKEDIFTMLWAAVTNELFNGIKPKDEITKFKTNITIVKKQSA